MPKRIDGKPVFDAKESIFLHISKNDCRDGDPKRPESCAAARTIFRELKAIDCRVHLGRVYVRQNKGNWLRYQTSQALRAEIIAFDRGGKFMPGEYKIAALQPSQHRGKRKVSKVAKSLVPQRGNRTPHRITNVRAGPA